MLEQYPKIKEEYETLIQDLNKLEIVSDPLKYQKLSKKAAQLKEILEKLEEFKKIENDLEKTQSFLKVETNPDLIAMAEDETRTLQEKKGKLTKKIEVLLLPPDLNNEKNVILEIRAGTGGGEAALFAADLFRMYSRFAERKNWQVNILNSNSTEIGGFKEIIFEIEGKDVYKNLKYESGVHRVQRIPRTESSGRIHTSTATVAVLPEAEEVEIQINPKDLKIETFRSSGAGGQHVNVTDSAVRITHLPTGIITSCQDERSQIKNRERALSILRTRLLAKKQEEEIQKRGEARRIQIGTGERSEKIRTYNFPQDRITDHRINFSFFGIEEFLNGALDHLIEKLAKINQEKLLEIVKKERRI